jgi:hypothetical protein
VLEMGLGEVQAWMLLAPVESRELAELVVQPNPGIFLFFSFV